MKEISELKNEIDYLNQDNDNLFNHIKFHFVLWFLNFALIIYILIHN